MGETTPVAHGGNPQDRTGSPRPRCIALIRFRFRHTETWVIDQVRLGRIDLYFFWLRQGITSHLVEARIPVLPGRGVSSS
ncbi:MAG: hypothetical protein F6J90_25975 [Moorea sp. SIOASIH]|uniref:hypothetical protein n=1 Tax=Moorena sp. SIOASIH TaxID=2607817 RepID=UPI0013BBD201|nr:hypothetical protein [Moorena sp. SIOASIH]NEO39593.1 hypothetical protein [Moorena sp. SIOASIH]